MARGRVVLLRVVVSWAGLVGVAPAGATRLDQPSTDRLVESGRLTASNAVGALSFGGVAISAQTIVAHSSQYPASGPPGSPESGMYVFTKPAGGWSGTLHDTAKLTASDSTSGTELGFSVAASGRTVVATGGGAVYVFTEPAGGWPGALHETAKLTASDGATLGPAAISGDTVAAGAPGVPYGAVYVFAKSPGGWSPHEAAKLTAAEGGAGAELGCRWLSLVRRSSRAATPPVARTASMFSPSRQAVGPACCTSKPSGR
jgi:hypothetical protein